MTFTTFTKNIKGFSVTFNVLNKSNDLLTKLWLMRLKISGGAISFISKNLIIIHPDLLEWDENVLDAVLLHEAGHLLFGKCEFTADDFAVEKGYIIPLLIALYKVPWYNWSFQLHKRRKRLEEMLKKSNNYPIGGIKV